MKIGWLLWLVACQATPGPRVGSTTPTASAPATPAAAPTTPVSSPPAARASRLITASGVRLREQPAVTAPEVARLSIGAVVEELSRSADEVEIGGQRERWYQVRTAAGQQGWVFGVVTAPVAAGGEAAARVELAERRLKVQDAPFTDRVDLYNMLAAATGPDPALLELLRLLAVRHALEAREVSGAQAAGVAGWARGLGALVHYDEISASWLLTGDALWRLADQQAGAPVGERAAWEASQSPVGGECEGDASCVLMALDRAEGRYLRAWPKGGHAADAIAAVVRVAGEPYIAQGVGETPREYTKELRDTLDSLRRAVEGAAPSDQRQQALGALQALAARVR